MKHSKSEMVEGLIKELGGLKYVPNQSLETKRTLTNPRGTPVWTCFFPQESSGTSSLHTDVESAVSTLRTVAQNYDFIIVDSSVQNGRLGLEIQIELRNKDYREPVMKLARELHTVTIGKQG